MDSTAVSMTSHAAATITDFKCHFRYHFNENIAVYSFLVDFLQNLAGFLKIWPRFTIIITRNIVISSGLWVI